MKFWELTLIMVLFNVFGSALFNAGLFSELGIYDKPPFKTSGETDINSLEQQVKESTSDQITSTDPATSLFGFISDASVKIINFFDTVKNYIFWPAVVLQYFGIPNQIGAAFTIVFNLIQIIGIIQILTGKSFMGVE